MITSITFDDVSPAYLSKGSFDSLLDLLDRIGISCTFFVVPGQFVPPFSLDADFKSCLKDALRLGHEISLHGYRHTTNEFGYVSLHNFSVPLSRLPLPSFDKQKNRMEQGLTILTQLTGVRPLGFRAPFYLYNDQTMKVLTNLGFKYDSTMTVFKPAHAAHLRVKWLSHCKPRRVHSLVEIPVTGDYTNDLDITNFSSSLRRAIRDFEWVMSSEGVFVMNIHPHQSDANLLCKFLQELIKKLYNRTCFSRLVDVALIDGSNKSNSIINQESNRPPYMS